MSGDGRRRDRRDNRASKKRKLNRTPEEELEAKLGFDLFSEGEKRLGWLLTFASSSVDDEDSYKVYSCVDLYFVAQDKMEIDVEAYLKRRYEGQIADVEIIEKEDLDLKNHLSGLRKSYLKLSFDTVQQLMDVKRDLMPTVERNKAKSDAAEAFLSVSTERREHRPQDFLDCITDVREYDVPYHVRFAIDNDIRCGQWYDVGVSSNNGVTLEKKTDLLQRAEVRICAFDIETTKLPLKFPDADYDLIMMISYMVDGQGYLIINRECVGDDIEDIEYTPKPEFEGCFKVTNAQNEVMIELLRLWFSHMQEVKPGIYVTYNGDFFDWPFLERRATHHGFKMSDAVTKAKLGYDPLEVNPEDMVRFAKEKPQAYKANVICPNKHQSDPEKFYNNHLLESETYIGGHVECLESGVFRSDIPSSFTLEPSAYQQLINNLDRDLQYAITVEGKMDLEFVSNYDEVKNAIMEKLVKLRDAPIREECPLIYHLDVAAMYPNIILTNRLQAYKRVLDKPVTELREAGICMRENPFYVDTVRSFRDRRYEYKGLNKVWKGKLSEAKASGNSMKIQEAQDMVVLYDSLQLAHKCILNSFYGYVMRKGARWYSMEMAGVVTYTGAKIIQNARLLVEKIGKPLELDTDGICDSGLNSGYSKMIIF
ncbi:DNA polymerase epsilon catalytic subunit A [Glycine soja]|nr:DNA polymerase epsilon catalytic subunit A [Glycine soja]